MSPFYRSVTLSPKINKRKLACDGGETYFWFILAPQIPPVKTMSLFVWSFYWRMKIPRIKKKKKKKLGSATVTCEAIIFQLIIKKFSSFFISVLTKEKPRELIIINISLQTNPYFLWWWHGHSTSSGSHFTKLENARHRSGKHKSRKAHYYLLLIGCQLGPKHRRGVTEASYRGRRSLLTGSTNQFRSQGYHGPRTFNYW